MRPNPLILWGRMAGSLALLAAVALLPSHGQETPESPLGEGARDLLGKVATETAALTEASRLAEAIATESEIREFAKSNKEQMQKLLGDIEITAQSLQATAAVRPDRDEQQEIVDKVVEEDGDEFDEAYLETVINIYEDMIGRLEEATTESYLPSVREFANRNLETVREQHLRATTIDERLEAIED